MRQPAGGSQWDLIFDQPIVEVQATGTSAEEVRARIDEVVARIKAAAVSRQDEAGVEPVSRVDFILSPTVPIVTYAEGSTVRVLVALAIVAGLAGWAGSATAGRLIRSRAARLRVREQPAEPRSKHDVHRPRAVDSIEEREVVKT